MRDSEKILKLIKTLKNKDSNVRREVARALGKIGDKRAVPALIKALKDENSSVRKAAEKALAEIRSNKRNLKHH